jgi:N-acetylmuramoyl-L-alanine amidase
LIDQIRPGDQPNTVTVTLNGRAGMARAASMDADNVTRVTVEVPPLNAPAETAAPTPAAPLPTAEPATPLLTATRAALQTIVIDPGHGGEDVSARGAGGVEEKQITLEVARRLRGLIENRLGIRVVLTRDEDRAVTLDERAAVANNSKANLFLSLHANAGLVPAVAGAEVFHARLDRESEEALRSAEEGVALPVLGGGSRKIDVIRWDLAQARHVAQSEMFAGMLEEDLRAHVTMGPRPLQEGPLRVLMGADMPAALVEMAYLTNPDQEQAAKTEAFQNSLTQGIYDAVLRFRSYLEEQGR